MKNTILINLFGGPGTGKSQTASGIFSLLKIHGVDCEYVQEYAKDKTWEESFTALENQVGILGKQYHRIWRVYGKVDVIVTDSPLMMSMVYDKRWDLPHFKQLVFELEQSLNSQNYFLIRKKPYNPNGRSQTEEQARILDEEIKQILIKWNIEINSILDGDFSAINEIVKNILTIKNIDHKYCIAKVRY